MFQRRQATRLTARLRETRRFIQVLTGPRQVGKTTLVTQVLKELGLPSHYASADAPLPPERPWIEAQWETARRLVADGDSRAAVLVLDEVQKITSWSEIVKRLWDEDSRLGTELRVVMLGSSPLLLEQGLSESLAGRFEVIRLAHWSYAEMREAFAWDLDRFIYFGGYPGAASLIDDEDRWARYVLDSLIETTVSRDILLRTRVDKPALLRRLFRLACEFSGQILSYQKMLGRLQETGNTTTLAHYLDLLEGGGLVAGLPKVTGQSYRRRASSPKLLVLNTALVSASSGRRFGEARRDHPFWGRLVETAVGAHLHAGAAETRGELHYWRDRGHEVDFVLQQAGDTVAVEVKSGRPRDALPGSRRFLETFPGSRFVLVGPGGLPLEEFLGSPPGTLFKETAP